MCIRLFKVFFVLALLQSSSVLAQEYISLNPKESSLEISDKIYYLEDDGSQILSDVRYLATDKWQKVNSGETLNKGYTAKTYWFKIPLEGNSLSHIDWLLHVEYHLLDSIQVFIPSQSGEYRQLFSGRSVTFNTSNTFKHTNFAYPLGNDIPDGQFSVYLRVNSKGPLMLPIFISQENAFSQLANNNHIYYGIYFGCLMIMVFYNLFIFFSFRDINYLYYVLTTISTIAIFMTVAGYTYKYVMPEAIWLNMYFTRIFMGFVVVTTGVFTRSFLQTKKYAPWAHKALFVTICLAFVATLLSVFEVKDSAINSLASLHSLLLLVTGIAVWKNGNEYARFYVLAWSSYLLGGILITLRNAGTLPINFWTTHGAEIGSALEVVLLSLALSDRYRVIKKEREDIALKNLDIQKKNNEELDGKVKLRTADLMEANEELKQVNEELSSTVEKVQQQHVEIAEQQTAVEQKSKALEKAYQNIQDSLAYAKRIQDAKLPQIDTIKQACTDAFVLFKPRDIVSGDFYWFAEVEGEKIIAVADCTGHGVPGAFMSMICSELLNDIVTERKELRPAQILRLLHDGVRSTLRQGETSNRDGMDLALAVIDKENETLRFAGAKNPLIYIQNGELHKIRGNKMSIGGAEGKTQKEFTEHEIALNTDTHIYIFSDGYQDQFGGADGRKLMSATLYRLLLRIHQDDMDKQKGILEKNLQKWMNHPSKPAEKQLDDILIAGLKICK